MSLEGVGRLVASTLLLFSGIWVMGGLILWLAFRDSPVGPMMAAVGALTAITILLIRLIKKNHRRRREVRSSGALRIDLANHGLRRE